MLVLLLIALAGCSGCVHCKPEIFGEIEKRPIPFQQVEIGLCEDYPKAYRSLASARQDFQLLQTNNIHVLRIAFAWDSIEAAPGQYDWSFWDDFVRMATDEFGIRLIPYVCYTPQWASTGNTTNFWRQPPKDNARFAEFVKTIVDRYKGRIHSWEIWNEPDNPEYWEGSVEQFADLLKAGSRAVRETDPAATVVLGGLAWNLAFLQDLLARYQISPAIDVVNLHSYYETWSEDPIEQIGDHVLRASRIIQQYGNQQPIWLAEVGYSDYRKDGYVSGAYRARFAYEHTPNFQADTLGRALATAFATGRVRLLAWYRIHDLPSTTPIIGDVNNRRLGVVDESGRPKPVLQTLVFFNSLFSGSFRCLDPIVRQTRTIQSDSEAHVFEKRDGAEFITTWLRTATWFADFTAEQDPRLEKLEVLLPASQSDKAVAYDEFGRWQSTICLRKVKGGEVILTVPLRGGELNVYERPPKAAAEIPMGFQPPDRGRVDGSAALLPREMPLRSWSLSSMRVVQIARI